MKTGSRNLTAATRRQKAFAMRLADLTYEQIGDKLEISRQAAYGLVSRELNRLNSQTESDADLLRQMELSRLEFMSQPLWKKAKLGDVSAITCLLRISERKSKLFGLDVPVKSEIEIQNNRVQVIAYIPDNGRPDDDKPPIEKKPSK